MYDEVISQYVALMRRLLSEPCYSFAEASAGKVPAKPGVYVIHNKGNKETIYAGRTSNLRRRLLGNHRRGNVNGSQFRRALKCNFAFGSEIEITNYILENCSFQFVVVEDFEENVRLEHFITAILAPTLNIKLRQ